MDVNQAFAGEKQAQIDLAHQRVADNAQRIADYDSGKTQAELDAKLAADVMSGKIRMVSADRYEVLTGWDANEIFRVQRAARPGELPLILPETGLDMIDGRAQLFSSVETWHQSGNVKAGVTSVDEVLELAGLDFHVEQRDVRYAFDGDLRSVPGHKVNVRSDTGAALGVVGKIYTPFQNRDGAAFLQELIDRYDVQFESAGPLNGGRKVFISMNLPENVVIDEGGLSDLIEPKICWMNNHDGEGKLKIIVTPWRPICKNTERFAVRDAVTSWGVRHTRNGLERAEEARRTLGFSLNYFDRFAAEETALARTAYELDEFNALIATLWPADDDPTKRQATVAARRESALHELWAVESKRAGSTAYAAERAVTGYLDHVSPRRAVGDALAAARATAILEGASDDVKSKAHQKLMLKVR